MVSFADYHGKVYHGQRCAGILSRHGASKGIHISQAAAAMGFDEVGMSRVRVGGTVRAHGGFGVRQLA
jgi:hypothetical protein